MFWVFFLIYEHFPMLFQTLLDHHFCSHIVVPEKGMIQLPDAIFNCWTASLFPIVFSITEMLQSIILCHRLLMYFQFVLRNDSQEQSCWVKEKEGF